MSLSDDVRDRLERETKRRPNATVDDVIGEAAQGIDDALCTWIGPTMATRWWRRFVLDLTGQREANE